MERDSLAGLLAEVEGTIVAHLFGLMAGMMVIVVVSVLIRVGDLLMRALVGAPFGATVGWRPSAP